MKTASSFIAITTEGGLLPADFLAELLAPKTGIEGLTSVSYNLAEGERINEQVNRSWNRLKGRWADFKKALADKQPGEPTTTETRDRWLQPLFHELGYGQRLPLAKPIEVDGRSYAVSHGWGHVPIHLVGSHIDLDRRTPGAIGAAKASPHSLVQQLLNASDSHLWGIISNGLTLRLVRDNVALTRLSYVEWDLAAIFDGDLYSEFFVLWLVVHQSRFDAERAEQCWLEKWKKIAGDKGLRALKMLRPGVARAIEALGAGLVSHPANKALRMKLSRGELSTQEFYRQALRVIYRMLFLFVAEDRDLLHRPLPGADAKEDIEKAVRGRNRYRDFYAITRLRGLTLNRAGTPHPDLWHIFQLVTTKLGSDTGCPELEIPALGSFLWDPSRSTPDVVDTLVSNRNFLNAVHALAFVQDGSVRRPIDYKNLGSEELGSVYEGLLELHPLINADTGAFELSTAVGNERKMSGSYYTPDSLVQCLLDSALEPVIAEAVRGKQGQAAADALLKLKICDPAVGSGHFLIAVAHRLANRVSAARSDEDEPSPKATHIALRDVIGRCLYGVDINPMSAELCRVSLWLEALEPGKPLAFLDHHIRVGNSLLGATAQLISEGLPDETFTPIGDDDKKACAVLRKRNKAERMGWGGLFAQQDTEIQARLQQAAAALEDLPDDRPVDIHAKELAFRRQEQTEGYRQRKLLADAWCTAFVIKKYFREPGREGSASGITQCYLNDIAAGRLLPNDLAAEVERSSSQYRFFHWHLAFPEVFAHGGFDCVLGNPPWEMMEAEDGVAASDQFARLQLCFKSNQYKVLNGRRDLYKLFLLNCSALPRSAGRLGFLTPLGVFIEDDAREWRQLFFNQGSLVQLRHFQNHKKRFFPGIHASYRFCAVTFSPISTAAHSFSTVAAVPQDLPSQYYVTVPRGEFDEWLGPERSATIYPSERYAFLHRAIAKSLRCVSSVNFRVVAEFHSSTDRNLIKSSKPENGWALLKNRNVHYFDHTFAPHEAWIEPADVKLRLRRKGLLDDAWFSRFPRLVFRDIARNDDERTLIGCLVPPGAVSTYDTPMFLPECDLAQYPTWITFYAAAFSSHLFDFMIRPVVDKHIKGYTLARIRWPSPESLPLDGVGLEWFADRILELVYTTPDFEPFAQDCGWSGSPFRWNEERRFLLLCEMDAAFFHLYLPAEEGGGRRLAESEMAEDLARFKASFRTPRDAVAYIMDTFPIVRRKDEAKFNGDYRTKRVILEIYDAMQESIRTGRPYGSRLNPPPADPRVAHDSDRSPERRAAASAQIFGIRALGESEALRQVTPRRDERYTKCVPRLDLKVAAGAFSDDQLPAFEDWVEINASRVLGKGMFVAQVVGRSMEPLIPDGAYCLFQFKAPRVTNDVIGLFQLSNTEDPELGGRFTVKRLKVSTRPDQDEGLRRVATLVPENPAFEPIAVEGDDVKFVAEFLEVLRPLAGDADEE